MKLIIITTCMVVLYTSLFSQQKSVSFDGEYQIRPGFNFVISTEIDGLYIEATGQPIEKLIKTTETLYNIESIKGTVDFSLMSKDDIAIVNMYGQTFHAPKLPIPSETNDWKEITVPAEALKGLDGEYQLNASSKFIVSIEGGSLFVQLTGQAKYQVFPYSEQKFFYKVTVASIEFNKDDKGDVKYMLLHQNGMILQADKL